MKMKTNLKKRLWILRWSLHLGFGHASIHTRRLTLRPLRRSDLAALGPILGEPETARPSGFAPVPAADVPAFYQELTRLRSALAVMYQGACIGYVHVQPYKLAEGPYAEADSVSLGFLLGRSFTGKGLGTEMLAAVTAYLARRFDFVFADCFKDNPASRRIIEKNGYRYLENYRMCFDALGEKKNVECFVHPGKQPLR